MTPWSTGAFILGWIIALCVPHAWVVEVGLAKFLKVLAYVVLIPTVVFLFVNGLVATSQLIYLVAVVGWKDPIMISFAAAIAVGFSLLGLSLWLEDRSKRQSNRLDVLRNESDRLCGRTGP